MPACNAAAGEIPLRARVVKVVKVAKVPKCINCAEHLFLGFFGDGSATMPASAGAVPVWNAVQIPPVERAYPFSFFFVKTPPPSRWWVEAAVIVRNCGTGGVLVLVASCDDFEFPKNE